MTHAHGFGYVLCGAGFLGSLLLLGSCGTTEPSGPFATYDLRACLFIDSVPRPIPCGFEQPNPGDTLRLDSGTFTLRVDSTWVRTTYQTYFLNGTWGGTAPYTLQGTFSPGPPYPNGQLFEIHILGAPDDPNRVALVTGDTLIYGVSLYTRQR